jgi:mannose-6-phosphate isomerase-like protein (cupin superfamily)
MQAFFIQLSASKEDRALQNGEKSARKILVTDLRSSDEKEAFDDVWIPPKIGEICQVQQMKDTESAIFTNRAPQDRHFHRKGTELYMVIEGQMRIEVGDKEYLLSFGDMLVVNSYAIHQIKPKETEFICRVVTVNSGGRYDKYLA